MFASLARVALAAGVCALLACDGDGTVPPGPATPTTPTTPQTVSGKLVTAGDVGPLTRVRVTLRSVQDGVVREFSDLAAADGSFQFDADLPTGSGDLVDLIVSSDDNARSFIPVLKRIAANESEAWRRPLLIARQVTIPSGDYAGAIIPVSIADAFAPICANATSPSCLAFYGLWSEVPVLWLEDAFPIPMAFFRRPQGATITPDDSAVFWANVASLEAEFGRDLFRPVDISALGAVTPDGLPERGNAVSIDPMASPALAGAWVLDGRLVRARTRANSVQWLRQRYVMNHELIHVLGFGHTCAWESLMCGVSPARQRATPADVAAFILAYEIDRAVRSESPTTTLVDALAGETQLLLASTGGVRWQR